jgi:hypothetical protein
MLADVDHLKIAAGLPSPKSNRQDLGDIDEIALLELLPPFTAMKTLCVGEGFSPALEGITRRMALQLPWLPRSYGRSILCNDSALSSHMRFCFLLPYVSFFSPLFDHAILQFRDVF